MQELQKQLAVEVLEMDEDEEEIDEKESGPVESLLRMALVTRECTKLEKQSEKQLEARGKEMERLNKYGCFGEPVSKE